VDHGCGFNKGSDKKKSLDPDFVVVGSFVGSASVVHWQVGWQIGSLVGSVLVGPQAIGSVNPRT
jgi:hypothetical protein